MSRPSLSHAGDRGLLVEFEEVSAGELQAAAALARGLAADGACVIGHSSLLVLFAEERDHRTFRERFERELDSVASIEIENARCVTLRTSFADEDAPDLPRLLERAGISRDEFLEQIAALRLRARFLGFRPGFAYLDGLPPLWNLPRRETSRRSVPAGSFALAAEMAAFYPSETPGGWNLIGRTDQILWNPEREPPNLIAPGDEVRIQPATAPLQFREELPVTEAPASGEIAATVLDAGQMSLIAPAPDAARYDAGLPPGGPMDLRSAHAANRAAGNDPDATLVECTLIGPALQIEHDTVLSWFGAAADLRIEGARVHEPRQFPARAGDRLEIGRLEGMRGYLAFSGGLVNPAGRYSLSPVRLSPGEHLRVRHIAAGQIARIGVHDFEGRFALRIVPGPHRLDPEKLASLLKEPWTVTPHIDRTGVRLQPDRTAVTAPTTVRSCGLQFGSVQLHPNGDLLIMGPDHPVTGGYLQPFTILSSELWKTGQLAPGDEVRFTPAQVSGIHF